MVERKREKQRDFPLLASPLFVGESQLISAIVEPKATWSVVFSLSQQISIRTSYVHIRTFWVVILLTIIISQECFGTDPIPVKKLWGKKYSAAVTARDHADLMRAEFEKCFSGPPNDKAKRTKLSQAEIDAKAARVIQAYQEVVDRYPHSEIAAYCIMRLSGFFEFQGKFDKAAELMSQTADEFAGTSEGNKAIFEAGLIHLQARHEPAEAIKWFSRIPKPTKPADSQYDEGDKLYLSAQQQMAKCELALRHDAQAKQRVDNLKQTFPQYRNELDRFYKFEIDSRDRRVASLAGQLPPLDEKKISAKDRNVYMIIALTSTLVILITVFIYRQVKRMKRKMS